jgi:hypothetical protein
MIIIIPRIMAITIPVITAITIPVITAMAASRAQGTAMEEILQAMLISNTCRN